MPRIGIAAAAVAATFLLLIATPSPAQKATERYIPLGRSPGLSAVQTYIGAIASADAGAGTVTVGAGAEQHVVRVTRRTRIWVDRTAYGKTNLVGGFDDLKSGRQAEVKYVDAQRRDTADWIKVVPEAPD